MKFLGLIPARSGSKSVQNKNMQLIQGKSLIQYSIESALLSNYLTDIALSSDSIEYIAHAIRSYDIYAIKRPENFSTDSASTIDAILHALTFMRVTYDLKYDAVVLLQPTCPMRSTELIDSCIEKFIGDSSMDSLCTVINVGGLHPNRMYTCQGDKLVRIASSCTTQDPMQSRQSLQQVYIRSGDIYIARTSLIESKLSILGNRIGYIQIEDGCSINIDTPADLSYARYLMQNR